MKIRITLLIFLAVSCRYYPDQNEFVFGKKGSILHHWETDENRILVFDTEYKKNISKNYSPMKFFFLNFIPNPMAKPTDEWKKREINLPISLNKEFEEKYKDKLNIMNSHDRYASITFYPNNFHLIDQFYNDTIFIFIMFDYQSRNYHRNTSWIGMPLDIELRLSIFKNNIQIASCQQIIKKFTFTNQFLTSELDNENSFLNQLLKSERINFLHKDSNSFYDKINFCMYELGI